MTQTQRPTQIRAYRTIIGENAPMAWLQRVWDNLDPSRDAYPIIVEIAAGWTPCKDPQTNGTRLGNVRRSGTKWLTLSDAVRLGYAIVLGRAS